MKTANAYIGKIAVNPSTTTKAAKPRMLTGTKTTILQKSANNPFKCGLMPLTTQISRPAPTA